MMDALVAVPGLLFLALLGLLHGLKPELQPSWRMISEYEIGKHGWLMRLAFFMWSASTVGLLIQLIQRPSPAIGLIALWLGLIAVLLIGAGIFKTDPITHITASPTNRLHTICGAGVILTFPIIATIVCASYASAGLLGQPAALIVATVLTWVSQVGYFASIVVSRQRNPGMTEAGPHIRQGWPNRIMVMVFVAWISVAALALPA